jgi:hypothetical protein
VRAKEDTQTDGTNMSELVNINHDQCQEKDQLNLRGELALVAADFGALLGYEPPGRASWVNIHFTYHGWLVPTELG